MCHRTKEVVTTRFTSWDMPQALFYKKCWLSPDLNPHSHSDTEVFCGWEWLLAGRTMTAGDMSGMHDLWGTLYSRWFHSSGKQSPLFKSEGGGKGTNVSYALSWAGPKMYLILALQPSYQGSFFSLSYLSVCSLLLLTLFGYLLWIENILVFIYCHY